MAAAGAVRAKLPAPLNLTTTSIQFIISSPNVEVGSPFRCLATYRIGRWQQTGWVTAESLDLPYDYNHDILIVMHPLREILLAIVVALLNAKALAQSFSVNDLFVIEIFADASPSELSDQQWTQLTSTSKDAVMSAFANSFGPYVEIDPGSSYLTPPPVYGFPSVQPPTLVPMVPAPSSSPPTTTPAIIVPSAAPGYFPTPTSSSPSMSPGVLAPSIAPGLFSSVPVSSNSLPPSAAPVGAYATAPFPLATVPGYGSSSLSPSSNSSRSQFGRLLFAVRNVCPTSCSIPNGPTPKLCLFLGCIIKGTNNARKRTRSRRLQQPSATFSFDLNQTLQAMNAALEAATSTYSFGLNTELYEASNFHAAPSVSSQFQLDNQVGCAGNASSACPYRMFLITRARFFDYEIVTVEALFQYTYGTVVANEQPLTDAATLISWKTRSGFVTPWQGPTTPPVSNNTMCTAQVRLPESNAWETCVSCSICHAGIGIYSFDFSSVTVSTDCTNIANGKSINCQPLLPVFDIATI